jgi:RimJ/RimL family protein N-acetyltransferase
MVGSYSMRGYVISVDRTFDYALIKMIATHPAVFRYVADDFHKDPEAWEPVPSEEIYYLLAQDEDGPLGFVGFFPRTGICFEGHLCFLPRAYGGPAFASFRVMLLWMWENTPAKRICGEIADDNNAAITFALRAGCEIYGVNHQSWLKNGIVHDRIALGISRPAWA